MGVTIVKKPGRGAGEGKIFYTLSWGRRPGQRAATGIFTYSNPKNQLERNHNKESIAILENKKAQLVLERQSISAEYLRRGRDAW